MRSSLGLLFLTLAVHAASFTPDIRADTNRDGVVGIDGDSDSADKGTWSKNTRSYLLFQHRRQVPLMR